MKVAAVTCAMVLIAGAATAQPRGGILTVDIVDGTTGGPGSGEKVTLYRLASEMVPVKELGAVSAPRPYAELVGSRDQATVAPPPHGGDSSPHALRHFG